MNEIKITINMCPDDTWWVRVYPVESVERGVRVLREEQSVFSDDLEFMLQGIANKIRSMIDPSRVPQNLRDEPTTCCGNAVG